MQNKLQIYLTAPDKNVLSQCVIIKTPNNKIVVVDGGHLEFEPCLAPAIRGILGLKDDEYFEIEAWFISHAHGDHYGELVKMFNGAEKNTNFKVNNIYFDFPIFENTNLHDFEPKFLQMYKDALDNYAKMHGIDCNGSCYDYLNGKVINRESVEKGLTITIDGGSLMLDISTDGSYTTTKISKTSYTISWSNASYISILVERNNVTFA